MGVTRTPMNFQELESLFADAAPGADAGEKTNALAKSKTSQVIIALRYLKSSY